MQKETNLKKQKIKIITIFAVSVIIILMTVYLLLKSSAWLSDRGKWTDNSYTIGQINYTYMINDQSIDTAVKPQTLIATVPVIGGVKMNDSAQVSSNASNYQKYADENFNEGVTLVHIVIENKSGFDLNGSYSLEFKNLFDSADKSQNLFYLILPENSVIDTKAKTVGGVSYKDYIKNAMGGQHATYEEMKRSLGSYYDLNPALKENKFSLSNEKNEKKTNKLAVNILFWSEYNDELPFVKNDKLASSADPNARLDGEFAFHIDINQKTENE